MNILSCNNKEKRYLGQFFTITNPFNVNVFFEWFDLIPNYKKETIVESFAGSNNIVRMIESLGVTSKWVCYDIAPSINNVVPKYKIIQQDTIINHPTDYYVGITNPPYLAKNTASRLNLSFPTTLYDDLYKVALDVILSHLEYVAVIIPNSYLQTELFTDRLYAYVQLNCKMFEDTECPVCLALFIPSNQKKDICLSDNDFYVYIQDNKIGLYSELSKYKENINNDLDINWKFNDKDGNIGICCIDNTISDTIRFTYGNNIDKEKVKSTSRTYTRVSGIPNNIDLDKFIVKCNEKLSEYRNNTYDLFLTSFKGLRKDNKFRRRLDYKTAKMIMNTVIKDMIG